VNIPNKRLLSLGLILIIMISISVVQGLTFTYNEQELKNKAETLLTSVKKINGTTSLSLTNIAELNYREKEIIENKYRIANTILIEAINLAKTGSYNASITKSLEAMSIYKNILQISVEINEVDINSIRRAEEIQSLKLAFNRSSIFLQSIEILTLKAKTEGYNVTSINKIVNEAKFYLLSSEIKLQEGKIVDAIQLMNKVKELVEKITTLQNILAKEIEKVRVTKYVLQANIRVTTLRQNITSLSSKVPITVVSTSLNTLNQAQKSLTAAETYYSSGMIKETVAELVNFREKELQTINILKDAGLTLSSVDSVNPK